MNSEISTHGDRPNLSPIDGGGITSVKGFVASGIHSGIKEGKNDLDMALIVSDTPCTAAGVFTKNIFCAAPVTVCRQHLEHTSYGTARAILVNSGNANAATGEAGIHAAQQAAATVAKEVECAKEDVLVASTGVIGIHLPEAPFTSGIPAAVSALSAAGGHDAARAIMTTDTVPKECAVSYTSASAECNGASITIGGMAKGSGMIMPDMATMIAVLTTDAALAPHAAYAALAEATAASFNRVTIDSDTSTNDTCVLLASGAGMEGVQPITEDSEAFQEFTAALTAVCENLARKIAADGEGATKLITVEVSGAASKIDADKAARSVANSPLVKTAVFGHDANWGRVAMALGKSGAVFAQEDVSIDIMGIPVCRRGLTVPFDEEEAKRRFEDDEIVLSADLGAGLHKATIWTCDLTYKYVEINGDYRT